MATTTQKNANDKKHNTFTPYKIYFIYILLPFLIDKIGASG